MQNFKVISLKITELSDLEVWIRETGSWKRAMTLLILVLSCRNLYFWKVNWFSNLFASFWRGCVRLGSYGDNENANDFLLSRNEKLLTQHFLARAPRNIDWIVRQHSSKTRQLCKIATKGEGWTHNLRITVPPPANEWYCLLVRRGNRFCRSNLNGQLLYFYTGQKK